ncbi:hypothetical protein [Salinicola rhizosphaerae]|uniref:Aminoglycoside phosphotransferase domain-containing protein n=1 Tax=Salinicola rhizosphaerae TaxID=1443141 RepID=A0ABQ3DP94_9GAMM|nr:hypothetical protein [Salinicola rhizosphaerae]GHB08891.1 hypothetical protein GCM10009038_03010 [Salinicola rhizosphaerae]
MTALSGRRLPASELTRRVSTYTGKALTPITLPWPDSANWLWRTDELAPQLLKLARTRAETDAFWSSLQALFGWDRWAHPEALTAIPGSLPSRLPLMPLPLTFLGRLQDAPLWSLPWREASSPEMGVALAAALGRQAAMLHRDALPGWGHPVSGIRPLEAWPDLARRFVETHPCVETHLDRRDLETALSWPLPSRAVWCLPDLRPDQLLAGATDWLWSDWEALVWAPIEFDLCLIELLLQDRDQRDAFVSSYRLSGRLPDLGPYRDGMRTLAVLMALHGDGATTRVMSHPRWLTI